MSQIDLNKTLVLKEAFQIRNLPQEFKVLAKGIVTTVTDGKEDAFDCYISESGVSLPCNIVEESYE